MQTTYGVNGKLNTTGHYRKPGTRTSYCGRRVSAPQPTRPMAMCKPCVKAEARDRAEATAIANQHRAEHIDTDAAHAEAIVIEAAEQAIADAVWADADQLATALLERLNRTTWHGPFIPANADDATLFALTDNAEQGALFI
ncbi:hypothetical protein E4K10_18140 [Streptomyces sp. T1317-0309]|nr:hypothetical protein E4K10_18140 [Streptomyces sp. T1317-0309]